MRGVVPGMGNLFLNNNRNKRSLVLNLKQEAGKAVLLKLAEQSDVLVSNVRPQAMARLGLAYSDLVEVNAQLIYVACFGFGQTGPYAERAAYDDLIQAMAGVPNLFERAYDEEPKFLPSNFCDRVTGFACGQLGYRRAFFIVSEPVKGNLSRCRCMKRWSNF